MYGGDLNRLDIEHLSSISGLKAMVDFPQEVLLPWITACLTKSIYSNLDPRALLLTEGEKSSVEQSKASLIGAFMLARGVSGRRNVQFK